MGVYLLPDSENQANKKCLSVCLVSWLKLEQCEKSDFVKSKKRKKKRNRKRKEPKEKDYKRNKEKKYILCIYFSFLKNIVIYSLLMKI